MACLGNKLELKVSTKFVIVFPWCTQHAENKDKAICAFFITVIIAGAVDAETKTLSFRACVISGLLFSVSQHLINLQILLFLTNVSLIRGGNQIGSFHSFICYLIVSSTRRRYSSRWPILDLFRSLTKHRPRDGPTG